MRAWRRPNGFWYAVIDGKRVSLKTKDRDTALRSIQDFKRRRATEGSGAETVAVVMENYLADRADKSSIAKMKDAWKALKSHFGHLRADQIDRDLCRSYAKKRKGRSHGTIIKELGTLHAALKWAGHPPQTFWKPQPPEPRDVFIDKGQFERLLKAAQAHHVKTFLMLGWYTAGRKEALLSLTWDQVSFTRKEINLGPGVGNKRRGVVPMAKELQAWLTKTQEGAVSDYVIEWAGDRVKSIRKGFDEAKARAKLGHITPHDLRRSAARRMVEQGISLHKVSQLLGHTNVTVTARVYARFSPGHLRDAVDAL
jgi:integrase